MRGNIRTKERTYIPLRTGFGKKAKSKIYALMGISAAILLLVLATALAQGVQSHRLSEIRTIDTDLDMQVHQVNASIVNASDMNVEDYIYHQGDTNTYFRFTAADDLQLVSGGRQALRMNEGTNPDVLTLCDGSTTCNIDLDGVMYVNGSAVGIGTLTPVSDLSVGGIGIEGAAIYGEGTSYGVYGTSPGFAGYFVGAAYVSGNLGIGTASPADTLTVAGTVNATNIQLASNCADGDVLKWSGGVGQCGTDNTLGGGEVTGSGLSGRVAIWNSTSSINSSPELFWDFSNARFGVGIASPQNMLHVDGGAGTAYTQYTNDATGSASGDGTLVGTDGTGMAFILNRANRDMNLGTAGSTIVTLKKDGDVGINAANPSSELQVGGTTPEVRIGDDDAEDTSLAFMGNTQDFYVGLDDTTDDLTIGTGTAVGTNVQVVIENDGDVGIGTATPGNKLDVVGNINATDTIYGGDGNDLLAGVFNGSTYGLHAEVDQANNGFAVHGGLSDGSFEGGLAQHNSNSGWVGVYGASTGGGPEGFIANGTIGIYGRQGTGDLAGLFNGNVTITGNLTVGTGTVFIDGTNSRVGIGTKTPSDMLEIETDESNNHVATFFNDGNSTLQWGIKIQAGTDDASGQNNMVSLYDGDNTYRGALRVNAGTVELITSSDYRIKEDIVDAKDSLEKINDLKVREFIISETGIVQTGFIAQELAEVIPDAVNVETESVNITRTVLLAKSDGESFFLYDLKKTHPELTDIKESKLLELSQNSELPRTEAEDWILENYEVVNKKVTVDSMQSLSMSKLVPHLTKAVQELDDKYQEEISVLKTENDALKQLVCLDHPDADICKE